MTAGFPALFRLKFSGARQHPVSGSLAPYPFDERPPTAAPSPFRQQNAALVKALMAPIFIVMVLAMMVLPLPPFALDLFFTFNIAMSLMVMLVAANMIKPLDFAAFPTVLLVTTLLRLSLNVASTAWC
jgi:flagellar biosynthesis component FlhA